MPEKDRSQEPEAGSQNTESSATPDWSHEISRRLAPLKLAPGREAEIVEELVQHLDDRYRELIAGGNAEDEARRVAVEELKDQDLLAKGLRRVEQETPQEPIVFGGNGARNLLTGLWQDIRYGFRQLRRNRGFTTVAVITLALGIGANTAIFSVVNGVLLRPLPYNHPGRLVQVFSTNVTWHADQMAVAGADFPFIERQAHSLAQAALFRFSVANLTGRGEPEQLWAIHVAPNFFPVLGVQPTLGRWFLPEEGLPGKEQVVILGHRLWHRGFGSDPGVLGRAITLDDKPYVVVGIMPPGFAFPAKAEAWIPLVLTSKELQGHAIHDMWDIARLKNGVALGQAQAELDSVARGLAANFPADKGWGLRVESLDQVVTGRVRLLLWLLLGAVGFVLVIACLNVAGLVAARGSGRLQEIALRQALGASRGRVLRQLMTECVLVAGMGGTAGVVVGWAGLLGFKAVAPAGWQAIPRLGGSSLDGRVLGFTVFVSFASVIIFGLLPALQGSHLDLNGALKQSGASLPSFGFTKGRRTRGLLVSVEVAMTTVLLVGCGLLLKSFWRLLTVHTGLDTHNVLMMDIDLPGSKYSSPQRVWTFSQEALERVEGLPGIQAAAWTNTSPYGGNMSDSFTIEGRPLSNPNQTPNAGLQIVSRDYFRVLGIPLMRGRWFTTGEVAGRPGTAIINQAFARRFFPNEDPIGKHIHIDWGGESAPQWEEIVGVVGNAREISLVVQPKSEMYADCFQFSGGAGTLLVRTDSNPIRFVTTIREAIWSVDKEQPIADTATLDETISASVSMDRFRTALFTMFAGLGLILAVVGIYGVVAFMVSQRTHEVGTRIALGASPHQIVGMMLGHGLLLALSGLGLGLVGALGLTRFLASFLYQIRPTDATAFLVGSLALVIAALLASWVPASRATKVDPMVALRYE
jgi:putative ABC transport system permease protein